MSFSSCVKNSFNLHHIQFICCRLGADSCKCEFIWMNLLLGALFNFSPSRFRFIFCKNETKGNRSWHEITTGPGCWKVLWVMSVCFQVSNQRITSFAGFQKDKWVPERSFLNSDLSQARTVTLPLHLHLPLATIGGADISSIYSLKNTNRSLIHMEKCDFLLLSYSYSNLSAQAANQDDSRLSSCNHLTENGGRCVDPSNLSEWKWDPSQIWIMAPADCVQKSASIIQLWVFIIHERESERRAGQESRTDGRTESSEAWMQIQIRLLLLLLVL